MSYRFHGAGLASSKLAVLTAAKAASFQYGECTSSGYSQKIAINMLCVVRMILL